MSINVTVNGNHLNIRRGRMVLSDLDQIKKNERDRRRRLRLEQVRQQSKEISDRLLKRAKNIAKEELKKLEDNDKLNLKQIHNEKIMEVQQKYQEDMEDIGQAHVCATLEPDQNAIIQEKDKQNKIMALKRGKEAIKQIKNTQQETAQQQHEERLRQVREMENLRSSMIAKLPQKTVPEKPTVSVSNSAQKESKQEVKEPANKPAKKTLKKVISKRSPGKITKSYIKVVGNDIKSYSPLPKPKTKVSEPSDAYVTEPNDANVTEPNDANVTEPNDAYVTEPSDAYVTEQQSKIPSDVTPSTKQTASAAESVPNEEEEVPNVLVKDNKTRYNPEDYVQATSSDSVSSFSDDSSYFSDGNEQGPKTRTLKYVKCPAVEKVQLYDHNKRQSNTYDKPVDVVEKIHTWNEPSAIDLAQEMEQANGVKAYLSESRKYTTQKRGEDAVLRERVRRDYETLLQNLDHLASEERKLKASQIEHYPKSTQVQERRKVLRDNHKKKLNHALKTLLNEESPEQCVSYPLERQITLAPRESDKNTDIVVCWQDPCCSNKRTCTLKDSQTKDKESKESREEQILDMLKKVERQKRLLLQEFGAELPNDIFNASVKPLFEKEKAVQTTNQETDVPEPPSPEVKVINVPHEENVEKSKTEQKAKSSVKKVETAVQTTIGEKQSVVEDKGTQVELTQEEKDKTIPGVNQIVEPIRHYPLEPKVTVIGPDVDESSSSATIITASDKRSARGTPKKTKRSTKLVKRVPSKSFQKSQSRKTSSFIKSLKSLPRLSNASSRKEDIEAVIYYDEPEVEMQPVPVKESVDRTRSPHPSRVQERITSKAQSPKANDVSDTSTSFVSLPSMKATDVLESLSSNMTIIELLDSSVNENIQRLKREVSPVSTPETPSPRTMRMPSNIPHPEKIAKLLKLSSTSIQGNTNDSVQNTSTSTEASEHQQREQLALNPRPEFSNVPVSLEFCLCNNPYCNQIHAKFDEIRNYALKNCPQILQKYEDLQTTCAERIISLTNLIEKVRNEQRGMEYSIINPADETSLMQLPQVRPKLMTDDLQSVCKLVENIEAIHNQLAKTLIESQKIIQNKSVAVGEDNQVKETREKTVDKVDTPKKLSPTVESKNVVKFNSKPTIVGNEKVNIPLSRFKLQHQPQTSMPSPKHESQTSKHDPRLTSKHDPRSTSKHNEEEMIEKLSKEILEQSRDFTKGTHGTVLRLSTADAINLTDSYSADKKDGAVTRKFLAKEQKKKKDFVPLLAGIPKVPKAADAAAYTNGRSKPPVSLLSGPHRPEIESSGHELSTIIEFDTPDTVNKSQNNAKSPSSVKKSAETADTVKPPEAVLLINVRNRCKEEACGSSNKKSSSPVSAKRIKESEMFTDLPGTSKGVTASSLAARKDKRENVIPESSKKKIQYKIAHQELEESMGTDPQNKQYANKDKITSTSSNSFSELSGISRIANTSSTVIKYTSSPEEMETALKKLGLGWAITTLKKTREASALSSSSNSDVAPISIKIPGVKKQIDYELPDYYDLPELSDISAISINEARKATERALLLKARTSTPKAQISISNSTGSNSSNTNISENYQEPTNDLIIPNISLTKAKSKRSKDQ